MEAKDLISRSQILVGRRPITVYKPTPRGVEFCNHILEPYEIMFPRRDSSGRIDKDSLALHLFFI